MNPAHILQIRRSWREVVKNDNQSKQQSSFSSCKNCHSLCKKNHVQCIQFGMFGDHEHMARYMYITCKLTEIQTQKWHVQRSNFNFTVNLTRLQIFLVLC